MLNLKKGLALVLAAATAFTFAPISSLGSASAVVAQAAENGVVKAGKVDSSIYAVSGHTYNLVDSDTQIAFNSNNYTGKELTWILTKATATLGQGAATLTNDTKITGARLSSDGTLTVSDAADFASKVAGAKLVGITNVNGTSTVVYSQPFDVIDVADKIEEFNISSSVDVGNTNTTQAFDTDAFDGIKLTGANGYFVNNSDPAAPHIDSAYIKTTTSGDIFKVSTKTDILYATAATGTSIAVNTDIDQSVNPLKDTKLTLTSTATAGVHKGTSVLEYFSGNLKYVAVFNISVSVNAGPKIKIADGENLYGQTNKTLTDDPTIYLDLKNNKTFDIAKYTTSDTPNTTYSYDTNSANVSVDDKGVITAKSVGTADVTVKPKANGVAGANVTLKVRVTANGFDTLTVVGKDKDSAKVLTSKEYTNNKNHIANTSDGEEDLVARQIGYVQIEVTGRETTNVKETPVVTSSNKANLTYSFADNSIDTSVTIDSKTGEITIPYADTTVDSGKKALGVYAVKVVSAETSTSTQTTSYYYVVVDYPDKEIRGLQDQYTVGVETREDGIHRDPAVALKGESHGTVDSTRALDKDDDKFVGGSLYATDDATKFDYNKTSGDIFRAWADAQTMHVLVSNTQDNTHGNTFKIVTIKSAPANDNYVTKIVNKDTGKTIYDVTTDSNEAAKKVNISDITTLQVTLHTPVAASGSAVSLKVYSTAGNDGNVINQPYYVTAVKNKNNVDVTLYPNSTGTQVIYVQAGGHNSATDRTDIHHDPTNLAVAYDGSAAPAKVTGLKVTNKKGAKVSVKWAAQASRVNYRVYKKVGNGKWIAKNVTSNKATLSVKKGAKVQVKVKAFVKDSTGTTTWGPKATKKTFKTDKK